jgi:aspartate ammonia-lyase
LTNACSVFQDKCVSGITANENVCKKNVENSTATATALVPFLGYKLTSEVVNLAHKNGISIKKATLQLKLMNEKEFEQLITPEAVCRLGN